MQIFRLAIAIALIYCCGSVLLRLIDRNKIYTGWLERASIVFPLGIFVIGFIQLYMLFAKVPLEKATLILFTLPFAIIQFSYYLWGLRKAFFSKRNNIEQDYQVFRLFRYTRLSLLEWLIVFYLIAACAVICFTCVAMPPYAWDDRGTWLLYPKIFFWQKTIFTADFLDSYRFIQHHNYPLLMSLGINFIYAFLGKTDDYTGKILFGLLYIDFALLLYVAQRKWFQLSRMHSLIFTAVFVSLPCYFRIINGSVPSAYSDFPLSIFYLLVIINLIKYTMVRDQKNLFIAGIFASACIFTKNEGLVLYILSLFILISEGVFGRLLGDKKFLKGFFVYTILPLLLLLPWFFIRNALPSTSGDNNPLTEVTLQNIISRADNIPLVVNYTLQAMFLDYFTWGVIWVIIVLTIILYFTPLEKAADFSRRSTDSQADGGLMPPSAQTVREQSSLTGFTNVKHFYANSRIPNYLVLIPVLYYFFVSFIYVVYMPYAKVPLALWNEFKYTADTYDGGGSFARLYMQVLPLLFLFASLQIHSLFKAKK